MESFGQHIKSLREEKGLSLQELSQRTKIALSNLEFLEADRFDLLPPRVFVKGFVKAVAFELGLEPGPLLAQFDEFTKEGEVPDYANESHPVFSGRARAGSIIGSRVFTVALTAAGVVSLAILLVTGFTRLFYWKAEPGTVQPTVTTVAPAGFEAPKAEKTEPKGPAKRAPGLLTKDGSKKVLEIKAVANAWVRVEADGGPAEELILAPGDVQIFTAKEGFQLQTGNAGGVRLRVDGREYPTLGKNNQTLSVSLP
jgi:cytoskeletal protein RodZ